MAVLIHLSDLHFGRADREITSAVIEVVEKLQPDCILISGDLTQRARIAEYREAVGFIKRLPTQAVIIPGNHDIPLDRIFERFFSPWEKWKQYIGTPLDPVITTKEYLVFGVNTVRRAGWYLDWSRGRLSDEQLGTIPAILHKYKEDGLRILMTHHPFYLPEKFENRHLVENGKEAVSIFSENGGDIIVSGHIHAGLNTLVDGVVIVQAGTAISTRREPNYGNSFNVIEGNRQRLAVSVWCWEGTGFSCVARTAYKRMAGKWQMTTVSEKCEAA